MRALITGATGMAGSHLADLLLAEGHDVHVTVRPRSRMQNVLHLLNKVTVHSVDIRSASAVERIIRHGQFSWIFHLAAQSSVPVSWQMADETMQTNIGGTVNVLEAIRQWSPQTTVHLACSSEQYGKVHPDELPISEAQPFRPLSPYGVSKIAQEYLGLQYAASYGLSVAITRAFNHEGPRRWETSAPAGFASQIADIEVGRSAPTLFVGNLDAVRDYLDVRDVVRAYYQVVLVPVIRTPLNICSGRGWPLREVVRLLLEKSRAEIGVETDPDRLRPSDVPILIGDSSLLRRRTNWEPRISFAETLDALLEEHRARSRSCEPVGAVSLRPNAVATQPRNGTMPPTGPLQR